MAKIKLDHVYKFFNPNIVAVKDFDFETDKNEFIVIIGPSGCGKSTTLRMIAGLEDISYGNLYIDGQLMNNISPKDRNIAMVFQNYALYPNYSVFDNLALGLKFRKYKKEDILQRVNAVAKKLEIENLLSRKPAELSGGQRQRVALGRALVREPKIFLFDEPLSNLDAKLRSNMRLEILNLYNDLSNKQPTTFIYVTHDQVEAMTMGTTIIVMNNGLIQQIDTPMNLYNNPANIFVAQFIGNPQINIWNVELLKKDKIIRLGSYDLSINEKILNNLCHNNSNKEEHILLGIRPEHILITDKNDTSIPVYIDMIEKCGADNYVYGFIVDKQSHKNNNDNKIVFRVDPAIKIQQEEIVYVDFKINNCQFFNKETGISLLKSNANGCYIPTCENQKGIAKQYIQNNTKQKKRKKGGE